MKKSILKTCLFIGLFFTTVQIGFSTIIVVCNLGEATVYEDNDGCNSCIETYGCDLATY